MYLFNGLLVWVICLVLIYFSPRLYVRFHKNPTEAKKRVDSAIRSIWRDIEDHTPQTIMWAGVVSAVIIFFWPLILFCIVVATLIALVGGIPYLVIRKLKSSVKQPDEWSR